jgi:hypothetical protein
MRQRVAKHGYLVEDVVEAVLEADGVGGKLRSPAGRVQLEGLGNAQIANLLAGTAQPVRMIGRNLKILC